GGARGAPEPGRPLAGEPGGPEREPAGLLAGRGPAVGRPGRQGSPAGEHGLVLSGRGLVHRPGPGGPLAGGGGRRLRAARRRERNPPDRRGDEKSAADPAATDAVRPDLRAGWTTGRRGRPAPAG